MANEPIYRLVELNCLCLGWGQSKVMKNFVPLAKLRFLLVPTSFSLLNFRKRRSAFGGKELYIKFACQVACLDKIYFSIVGTAWERKKCWMEMRCY